MSPPRAHNLHWYLSLKLLCYWGLQISQYFKRVLESNLFTFSHMKHRLTHLDGKYRPASRGALFKKEQNLLGHGTGGKCLNKTTRSLFGSKFHRVQCNSVSTSSNRALLCHYKIIFTKWACSSNSTHSYLKVTLLNTEELTSNS